MADDGLARFQRRMEAIPRAARQAVKPALVKAAEDVAHLQRALAPEKTGKLKDSIHVTGPGEATPAYSQPGGSMVAPANAALITVGNTDVRYAHLVEYGHSNGFVKGGKQGGRGQVVPPNPFFWPGFRLGQKKASAAIKRAIRKAIKEAK